MPHVFFGLTMVGVFALCGVGVLPSSEFVVIGKWVTVLYAASTTVVAVVRHVWPRPAAPQFGNLAVTEAPTPPWIEPDAEMGVALPVGFGSLHDDVFSEPIGHGVPRNYTSMIRDRDAPPVTTDGADGSPVLVPSVTSPLPVDPEVPLEYLGLLGVPAANRSGATPALDFDGVFGPKPPIPHDYNRSRPPPTKADATRWLSQNTVVLGDPPKKEDPT